MAIEVRLQIEDQPSREYHFDRSEVVIGCHPFNDLVINDAGLTARHGRLMLRGRTLCYEDLDTSAGARVEHADGRVERVYGGKVVVERDATLMLGAEGDVRLTILGFRAQQSERSESHGVTSCAVCDLIDGLEPETRRRGLDGLMQLISCTTLREAITRLEAILSPLLAGSRFDLVLPQGERAFQDVIVRSGEGPEHDLASPDAGYLRQLRRGDVDGLSLTPREGGSVELVLPFDDPAEGGAQAYLRVHSPARPSQAVISQLVALAAMLRPAMRNLVRLNAARRNEQSLLEENQYFRRRGPRSDLGHPTTRSSAPMQLLEAQLEAVVDHPRLLLFIGEAGSGKELVARTLHQRSVRRGMLFIAQNCGKLSSDDLDVELFGCGGASPRKGLFELASGGTLFLDEVDRLSLELQARLLRVIHEHEIRRAGESVGREVDTRLFLAIHRDLGALVRAGDFRRDLHALLCSAVIRVPPLRERAEDLLPLAEHFINRYSQRYGLEVEGLDEAAQRCLAAHSWPGNVRELQVLMETAVMKARRGLIAPHHLGMRLAQP